MKAVQEVTDGALHQPLLLNPQATSEATFI